MLTTIIIEYDQTQNFIHDLLDFKINNRPVQWYIYDNYVEIKTDLEFGLHNLQIKINDPRSFIGNRKVPGTFEIKEVKVNGCSLRHTMYLSYYIRNGQKENTTILSDYHPLIVLPFGNPVSWWLGETAKHIPNGTYNNVESNFKTFYPESVLISNKYPQLIQDFFQHNFSFTTCNQSESVLNNKKVPYAPLNLEYNEQALIDECIRNQDIFKKESYSPSQTFYNKNDDENYIPWAVHLTLPPDTINDKQEDRLNLVRNTWPEYVKLIESIKGINVLMSFIAELAAGSYVAPHVDDHHNRFPGFENHAGCCQIHIPIGWKKGNIMKFEGVGIVPQKPILANTLQFTHASINDSFFPRYTIAIFCEFIGNDFEQYIV